MFRTGMLAALLMVLAAFPAVGQTTPNTPVPPQATGQTYPLKRVKIAVHLLGKVSARDRTLLRKEWLLSVRQQVLVNWHPLLPETTTPPMEQRGTTVLVVRIGPKGRVRHEKVERSSGVASLDRAAEGAAKSASPLPPFPPGVKAQELRLKMRFVYD